MLVLGIVGIIISLLGLAYVTLVFLISKSIVKKVLFYDKLSKLSAVTFIENSELIKKAFKNNYYKKVMQLTEAHIGQKDLTESVKELKFIDVKIKNETLNETLKKGTVREFNFKQYKNDFMKVLFENSETNSQVFINGVNINQLSPEYLSKEIYVLNESNIISDTFDNITFDNDIEQGNLIYEKVECLKLSQNSKLLLARAIYNNPSILIIDNFELGDDAKARDKNYNFIKDMFCDAIIINLVK